MINKLFFSIVLVFLFVLNSNAQHSNVQRLLVLQDQMGNAKNVSEKRNILKEASDIASFTSFMFISKSLNDEAVNKLAAILVAKLALNEKNIKGPAVREILVKALPLLKGKEGAVLQSKLTQQMSSASFNDGFENLFNEKDLTGWKGLVANPIERNKMSSADLKAAEKIANEQMPKDWQVKNGLLAFQGHGDNIVTEKKYGNFELFVDWKIAEKGDAGIY